MRNMPEADWLLCAAGPRRPGFLRRVPTMASSEEIERLRAELTKLEAVTNEQWLASLSPRKRAELEFFYPSAPADIAGTAEKLLSSSCPRKEMARKGRDRASLFSWRRTAEETRASYSEILRLDSAATKGRTGLSTS